jgi:glyoxylase-like metal-dependent hydrolase (beta-lactamase superfamily II)
MSGYTAGPPREILPGVYQWTVAWHRYTLESYLVDTDDGVVAIDPQDLSPRALGGVLSRVRHVILTNHYHERAAAIWRHRFDAPVWAPAGDVGDLETLTPNHVYSAESELPGGLLAVGLGGISAGEHALFSSENRGVLFVGDALGTTSYWTHGEGELGAHPRIRPPEPLRKLLELNFTSLAVGHGEPILDQAKVALATYLESACDR